MSNWYLNDYYNEWINDDRHAYRIVSSIWVSIQGNLITDNNMVNLSKRADMDGEDYHNTLISRLRACTKIMVGPIKEKRFLAEINIFVDNDMEYFLLPEMNLWLTGTVNTLNGNVNDIVNKSVSTGGGDDWLTGVIVKSLSELPDMNYCAA